MKDPRPRRFILLPIVALAFACSSARDVEVTGSVASDLEPQSGEQIQVDFYDRASDDDAEAAESTANDTATPELELVHSMTLESTGTFTEVVPVEGDSLYVVATLDQNGDEACNAGEAWGQVETRITQEDTAKFSLRITARTRCPDLPE